MTDRQIDDGQSIRLLVFTDKQIMPAARNLQDDRAASLKVDIISNVPALIASLNLNPYQLCLIDYEVISNGSRILEILKLLASYEIPVLIRPIGTSPMDDTIEIPNIKGLADFIGAQGNVIENDNIIPRSEDEMRLINLLAATINHEVNSPLLAITANVELVLKEIPFSEGSGLKNKICEIGLAAKKIEAVLRRLRESDNNRYKKTPAGIMIDLKPAELNSKREHPVPSSQ